MVLGLGRGRGRRVLVLWDVFGANVVGRASVLRVTGSMSVSGTMVVEGASGSDVTDSKTDLGGGISGFAVVWGLGSNCFGGFESIVGPKGSGCTVAGSRAGLDLGTSGLGVVLGRGRGRRPGRFVFGGANVVEGLVPSVPGSKTIGGGDGGGVSGSRAGLVCVTSGLRGILGFKEINGVLLGASVVHVGSGLLEILDVIIPGRVVLSGLVLGILGLRRRLGVEGIDVVCRGAGVVGCISGLVKISSSGGTNGVSLGASVALGCSRVLEVLGGRESRNGSLVAV